MVQQRRLRHFYPSSEQTDPVGAQIQQQHDGIYAEQRYVLRHEKRYIQQPGVRGSQRSFPNLYAAAEVLISMHVHIEYGWFRIDNS